MEQLENMAAAELGFPKSRGSIVGGHLSKDFYLLVPMLGSACAGKAPNLLYSESIRGSDFFVN